MVYEEGYYVNSSVSNYIDYRQKKYDQLATDLIQVLLLKPYTTVLDFGAATGALLSELIKRGISRAVGTDISYWAVEYGRKAYSLDSARLQHFNRQLLEYPHDVVLFLDVLEHITSDELDKLLSLVNANRLVVRIPVSYHEGEDYVLEVSRNDKTHIQIHSKEWWSDLFAKFGYRSSQVLTEESIYESDGVLARVYTRRSQ